MQRVLFVLECDHIALLPATSGESAPCLQCGGKTRRIKDIRVYEWHAKCTTAGCRMGKYTGMSEDLARFLASGHMRVFPSHVAVARRDPNPVAVKVMKKRMSQ